MHNFMYVFNKKLFHFYLELRLRTLEISWTKSNRCISKILIRFGSFLAFLEKNTIWPYLVIFGLFLDVIWLCACAEAYQPWSVLVLVSKATSTSTSSVTSTRNITCKFQNASKYFHSYKNQPRRPHVALF